ncbi:MAG TPA: hypothetical protein VIH99_03905 [Bdellovibrionota bacterium]|jgi:hypothetical protein
MILVLHILALALPAQAAELPRASSTPLCARLQAESVQIQSGAPKACDESKETHARFLAAFAEVNEACKRLEAQANNPAPTLFGASDRQKQIEIMDLKQKHITEREALLQRFGHELLRTPLDNDDPLRPPPATPLSDACAEEMQAYARFRNAALQGIANYFQVIEKSDDALLLQAQESPQEKPLQNRVPADDRATGAGTK